MFEELDLLCKAKLAELEKHKDKLVELMPKFETEEEALEYAKRIVINLQPGDVAKVPYLKRSGLVEAVFYRYDPTDGGMIFITYNPQGKHLETNTVSPAQVVLE